MGLKEDLERNRLQQQKTAEKEAGYRRLYEKIWGAGRSSGGGWRQWQLGMLEIGAFAQLYQNTLPAELPPEYRAVVDEFIELCPSSSWENFTVLHIQPEKVYTESHSSPTEQYVSYRYGEPMESLQRFVKLTLPDGTVHLDKCDFRLDGAGCRVEVRSTLLSDGWSRAKKQAQQSCLEELENRLDICRRYQAGTQDYQLFRYLWDDIGDRGLDRDLVIFRDGMVFDTGHGQKLSPLNDNPENLYKLCLSRLTSLTGQH